VGCGGARGALGQRWKAADEAVDGEVIGGRKWTRR
jgi:hypothetical protein